MLDGTTFDTLSSAVAHVLPEATVVGVVDARNPHVATADELDVPDVPATVNESFRAWLRRRRRRAWPRATGSPTRHASRRCSTSSTPRSRPAARRVLAEVAALGGAAGRRLMRPLLLTFSGLRSYRDTTTIDFSHLDLFAVIGDTGAGKSTIIEALSLALYAKKSWTGGPAGLADMIADGLNTMRIELRFQADDHEWVVTRARHRNASAPVDKLTSPTGGGPNVDGARQVTERVTELVGLDHDQFTRAVVLPQGRFDLLLRATERQRTEILSSILGLGDIAATRAEAERVRDTWNERAVEMRTKRSRAARPTRRASSPTRPPPRPPRPDAASTS